MGKLTAGIAASLDPTRTKLLDAAGQVFAEHGFHAATVRDICARAGANVAAVNYHFGDKVELYEEVLRQGIFAAHDAEMRAVVAGMDPEQALRHFVRYMVAKLCDASRPSWTIRIMAHEMAQPTPSLSKVVDEIMRPNYLALRTMIGRMLELSPNAEKTRFCAHSLIGQVLHYWHARPVIGLLWGDLKMTQDDMGRIAEHIANFTLAYLNESRPKHRKSREAKHD